MDYDILKQKNHDISYKLEQSQLQEQLKMLGDFRERKLNIMLIEKAYETSYKILNT